MKTADRENQNHGVAVPRNRAHGAVGQNRSCSIKWAAKQEKFRPTEKCFFLTSTFIELHRTCAGETSLSDECKKYVTLGIAIKSTSLPYKRNLLIVRIL